MGAAWKKIINAGAMYALLEEAVAERGADWRYPGGGAVGDGGDGCVYAYNPDRHATNAGTILAGMKPGPACIVGKVVDLVDHRMLVTLDDKDYDKEWARHVLRRLNDLYPEYEFTNGATAVAEAAQTVQDSFVYLDDGGLGVHATWGEALAAAKEALDSLGEDA